MADIVYKMLFTTTIICYLFELSVRLQQTNVPDFKDN